MVSKGLKTRTVTVLVHESIAALLHGGRDHLKHAEVGLVTHTVHRIVHRRLRLLVAQLGAHHAEHGVAYLAQKLVVDLHGLAGVVTKHHVGRLPVNHHAQRRQRHQRHSGESQRHLWEPARGDVAQPVWVR